MSSERAAADFVEVVATLVERRKGKRSVFVRREGKEDGEERERNEPEQSLRVQRLELSRSSLFLLPSRSILLLLISSIQPSPFSSSHSSGSSSSRCIHRSNDRTRSLLTRSSSIRVRGRRRTPRDGSSNRCPSLVVPSTVGSRFENRSCSLVEGCSWHGRRLRSWEGRRRSEILRLASYRSELLLRFLRRRTRERARKSETLPFVDLLGRVVSS